MHNLGNQGQRLQRARSKPFDKQQGGKVAQFLLVRNREHGSQPFEIDILRADVVMRGHGEFANFGKGRSDGLFDDVQQSLLGLRGARIDQVQDDSLRLAENCRVRIRREVADLCRVPVVTASQMARRIHALLNDGPFAGRADNEGMQVELESVADGVVIDAGGETAGARQRIAVQSGTAGKGTQFVGRATGVTSASSADVDAKIGGTRIESTLERPHHRGCDAGGVPVHAHYAAQGLEPERIAQPGEKFRRPIRGNNVLDNHRAELGHAFAQPRRYTASVKREIGGAGTLHASILLPDCH